MSEAQNVSSVPHTEAAGVARWTFHTCFRCLRTNEYRMELRDAHLPAPRNAFGRWAVCVCGYEWPLPSRSILDA